MGKAIAFAFWVMGVVALWPTATERDSRRDDRNERPVTLFGYGVEAQVRLTRRTAPAAVCQVATDTVFVIMPSRQWSAR